MSERGSKRLMRFNVAEEAQLLAEEKWLIDSLKTVREQLNCMQIERLHLMTLLEQYEESVKMPSLTESSNPQTQASSMEQSSTSFNTEQETVINNKSMGFEFDQPTGEELDLTVSQPVFRQDPRYTMEEFEEEHDMDPEDNVFVDMNMLMNLQNEENF